MDPQEKLRLCDALLKEHGLKEQGWRVTVSSTKRTLGRCFYNRKIIEISAYVLRDAPWDRVKVVMLHEMAHAFAGHKAGHGPLFAREAVRLGIPPGRFDRETGSHLKVGYHAHCEICVKDFPDTRYRLPRTAVFFRSCGHKVSWKQRG